MLKYYWYLSSYWRKHGKWIISSVFVAILIFSITMPFLIKKIGTKRHIYIGLVGTYSLESLPEEVLQLLSFGLTKINPDGTVDPALCERWSVEEDGKVYRFIIKKGLKWQDGSDFKPEDVNYQLEDTQVIATENDIVFKLPDEFVPFPTFVSEPIVKETKSPIAIFFKRDNLMGLGKYRIENYQTKGSKLSEITLESSQNKLTYRFYLTQDQAITAFKLGKINLLKDIENPGEVKDWPNVKSQATLKEDEYSALFFNISSPLFDKNVRQSFSYAITKPEGKERAEGPVNPNSWVYLNASKTYDYDLDRAIERLLSSIPENPLQFSLLTTPNYSQDADKIKQELEELGKKAYEECQKSKDVEDKSKCENLNIQISIQISNFPDLNNFDTALITRKSPPDPDQYTTWHSDQVDNFSKYKNTRIDSLLEKGRQVADKEERKAIYQEFQQFLLEDAPAVFIKHPTRYEIERK